MPLAHASRLFVHRCLRNATFSRFGRTPTCDKRTDRRTHDDSIYGANIVSRGKNHMFKFHTNFPSVFKVAADRSSSNDNAICYVLPVS